MSDVGQGCGAGRRHSGVVRSTLFVGVLAGMVGTAACAEPTTNGDSGTEGESATSVPATAAPGTELGRGAIGGALVSPTPHPTLTIYVDQPPRVLLVEFLPPDQSCIAAEATATVGRGGAILVSLFVDGAHVAGAECADGADHPSVPVPLTEPLADRRIYTSTIAETGGASAAAEAMADQVIGEPVERALELIEDAGLEVRDLSGAEAAESDFNSARINLEAVDGLVEFAWVG